MPAVIDKSKCNGCELCALYCPLDVIYMVDGVAEMTYADECWHCGACRQDCAKGAITFKFPASMLAV